MIISVPIIVKMWLFHYQFQWKSDQFSHIGKFFNFSDVFFDFDMMKIFSTKVSAVHKL